ncbi:hypothetical protein ABK040_001352 [Willaertia magna]
MHIFVTVGTTKFEDLIKVLSKQQVLSSLYELGYTSITFQIGEGIYEPNSSVIFPSQSQSQQQQQDDNNTNHTNKQQPQQPQQTKQQHIQINYFRKKPSISEDMKQSNLIITAAGAGNLFEALSIQRQQQQQSNTNNNTNNIHNNNTNINNNIKIIAVPNETLMGNHQLELAKALDENRNVYMLRIKDFEHVIINEKEELKRKLNELIPLEKANTNAFRKIVDEEMMI